MTLQQDNILNTPEEAGIIPPNEFTREDLALNEDSGRDDPYLPDPDYQRQVAARGLFQATPPVKADPYDALMQSDDPKYWNSTSAMVANDVSYLLDRERETASDDLWRATTRAEKMPRNTAIKYISDVARRLPPDLQKNIDPRLLKDELAPWEQQSLKRDLPEIADLFEDPGFAGLFGFRSTVRNMGTLRKLWHFFNEGGRRGLLNFRAGHKAHWAGLSGGFENPEAMADLDELRGYQTRNAAFLDALTEGSGPVEGAIGSFLANFMDMMTGYAESIQTPETLAATATGLFSGGPSGALAAGLGYGPSMAMANSVSGSVAQDIFENTQDESLGRTIGALAGAASGLLELVGFKVAYKGLSPATREVIKGALAKAAPESVGRLLAAETTGGAAARLARDMVERLGAEVITEAIQEGPIETGAQIAAAKIHQARGGQVVYTPTFRDAAEASWEAAKMILWGGGLLHVGGAAATSVPDFQKARTRVAAKRAVDTFFKRLEIAAVKNDNAEMKAKVKALTETIRNDPNLMAVPLATSYIAEKFGPEAKAYVNAEVLNTLFQSAPEVAALDMETIAADFLGPLGVDIDQFYEALETGTDVQIKLSAVPQVVEHPLWDLVAAEVNAEPAAMTAEREADLEALGPPPVILPTADAEVSLATRADLEKRLIAAGRQKSLARREAAVWSRMAGTLARITGAEPDAIINMVLFAKGDGRPSNIARSLNQRVIQAISSADTSLRQVAAALRKIKWEPKTVNLDIGGGRYDEGTNYLAELGVTNLVFDPFNRDEQHNRKVVEHLQTNGSVDTVTATNVLNVIKEPEIRAEVVRQAARAVRPDGVAYFQIYEGDGGGQGKATPRGWQNNLKTDSYIDEVGQYFGDVKRRGNIIEARDPNPGERPAIWNLEGADGPAMLFQRESSRSLNQDVFGKEFAEFRGRPDEALEHLLKEKRGYVPEAFYRDELGGIDLAWGKGGKGGFGLAHIIERRQKYGLDGESFVRQLPSIINDGRVEFREAFPGRAYIVHEESEAVISLNWMESERAWLLTAYPWTKENAPEPQLDDKPNDRTRGDEQHLPSSRSEGVDKIIDKLFEKDKSLFQAGDNFRGRTDFFSDGRIRVAFGQAADASTAMHEFQHIFIDMALKLRALAPDKIADPDAHAQLMGDIKTLEDWAGVADGQWTEAAHERVAEAFEVYLMEGKAPVKELRGVFQRMKKWLMEIYKGLKALHAPLSDDVRRVFDRQLASDEELLVESWRGEPAFDQEEMREADPALYAEYAEASAKADAARQEEIIAFRNAERERLIKQWRREGRAAAKEDIRQTRLADIKSAGGLSRASLEAAGYDSIAIAKLSRKRPGLVSAKSRVGVDEFAERYGFEYADDFVQEILNTPSIEDLTSKYVAEQEAYFEEYFESESIITDAELDQWEAERNLWARYMGEPGSKYQNRSWRDIKKIIDQKTGIKPVDEIAAQNAADLKASLKAQTRVARAAHRAGKAEAQQEARAKTKERADLILERIKEEKATSYRRGGTEGYYAGRDAARAEALEQRLELAARLKSLAEHQREIAKTIAQFNRAAKQNTAKQFKYGGILPAYHSQIKALLHQFGIGPEVQTEMSLADFIAREKEHNAGLGVADWIVNGDWPTYQSGRRTGERIPLRSLPLNQFNDVKRAVANLTFLGRRQQKVMVDGQLQDLDQVVERLVAGAAAEITVKAPRTEKEIFEDAGDQRKAGSALLGFFRGFMPALLKIETICRVLDGGKYGGQWQKTLYEAVNKAHHDTLKQTEKMTADISAIIDSLVGKSEMIKWRGSKVIIDGVPWTFTQEQLFMYIMHQGNSQNIRLARNFDFNNDGEGVNTAQHQAIVDAAPKEMWDLAQALWDYQDQKMFPELNALTLRTTGLPLKKVEADAVMTRYGQYRGGYSPIVFDRRMSETAERLNANRDSAQAAANRYRPGKTNAGATNERTGTSYNGLRASLSFDALAGSWTENIYDLNYREATNDIKRVLADPRIRQTVSGAFSEQHLQQFDLWLQEQIAPGSERKSTLKEVDESLRAIRRNITTAAMGFKASVTLCQPSGLFQAMHKIGPINTAIGLTSFFSSLLNNGRPFLDELYRKSPELGYRNASGSFDRDIKDSLGMRNPLHKTLRDKFDDAAFKLISLFDQMTANSIWTGAYLDAQKSGQSENEAIEYANSVVRTTQSTGASKDLSYAQRGLGYGDLGKIFTMFGTFFSASHNLFWEQYQLTRNDLQKGDYGRAARGAGSAFLFMSLLPAIYDALLRDGFPEDEEELEDMGKGVVSYFVGGIPIVKDLVGRALGTSFRFQPAPILGTLDDMTVGLGSGVKKIATGEDGGWTQAVRGLGGWTGLPAGQITTTMKGIEEWDDREGLDAFYRLMVRESPK